MKCPDSDSVFFGSYLQEQGSEEKTPIEWLVLENEGNRALLLSRHALDAGRYHAEPEAVAWESCTLRHWLNTTFYDDAFSDEEKESILPSIVSERKDPAFRSDPGRATLDRLFLLSAAEAEKYFPIRHSRKCLPTDYARARGTAAPAWLLRSPGVNNCCASVCRGDGSIRRVYAVDSDGFYIRPALWVKLDG